jgi:pyrroline-5-carboxylate reductase
MAAASEVAPATLREQVTSRGGTTAAAMLVLNDAGVRDIFARAVAAASDRSSELAREYGAG